MSRKRYPSDKAWRERRKQKLHEHEISNGVELGFGSIRVSDFVKEKILSGKTKVLMINGKLVLFHKGTEGYWENNSTFKGCNLLLHREKYKQEYGLTEEQIKGYEVHHIDGNKDNNDISNLKLLSKGVHARHHLIDTRTKLIKKCECCGKEFKTYVKRSRFCSNRCDKYWRRNSGLYDVKRVCKYCGKEFTCYKYKSTQFCSLSCSTSFRYYQLKN